MVNAFLLQHVIANLTAMSRTHPTSSILLSSGETSVPASSFFASALSGLDNKQSNTGVPSWRPFLSLTVTNIGTGASESSEAEDVDVDPQDEVEEAQKAVKEAKERVLDDAKRLRDIAQVCAHLWCKPWLKSLKLICCL
jgi:hypothetical protein